MKTAFCTSSADQTCWPGDEQHLLLDVVAGALREQRLPEHAGAERVGVEHHLHRDALARPPPPGLAPQLGRAVGGVVDPGHRLDAACGCGHACSNGRRPGTPGRSARRPPCPSPAARDRCRRRSRRPARGQTSRPRPPGHRGQASPPRRTDACRHLRTRSTKSATTRARTGRSARQALCAPPNAQPVRSDQGGARHIRVVREVRRWLQPVPASRCTTSPSPSVGSPHCPRCPSRRGRTRCSASSAPTVPARPRSSTSPAASSSPTPAR